MTVVTLTSRGGIVVRVMDVGATLMGVEVPDRFGRTANVLLGYDDPADYPAAGGGDPDCYLGATCGRVANRIAGAAFVLDGVRYPLPANEGPNHLHGGPDNFHSATWDVVSADARSVVMRHRSPDGDQGYPGTLDATATYSLSDAGELSIVYTATTTRPTHVNLVSHGYFNLSGDPGTSILDHRLRIDAPCLLSTDAAGLPTGERRRVAGSRFDFTVARRIGDRIDAEPDGGRGYNHNYIVTGTGMRPVAWLSDPASGRTMTLSTDQPGLQFYSGDFLGGTFAPRAGLCLEAQHWPDSPNHADFPSTRLDPGMRCRSETRLRFGVGPADVTAARSDRRPRPSPPR